MICPFVRSGTASTAASPAAAMAVRSSSAGARRGSVKTSSVHAAARCAMASPDTDVGPGGRRCPGG